MKCDTMKKILKLSFLSNFPLKHFLGNILANFSHFSPLLGEDEKSESSEFLGENFLPH